MVLVSLWKKSKWPLRATVRILEGKAWDPTPIHTSSGIWGDILWRLVFPPTKLIGLGSWKPWKSSRRLFQSQSLETLLHAGRSKHNRHKQASSCISICSICKHSPRITAKAPSSLRQRRMDSRLCTQDVRRDNGNCVLILLARHNLFLRSVISRKSFHRTKQEGQVVQGEDSRIKGSA